MQVTGSQHTDKGSAGQSAAVRDESKLWEGIAAAQYKLDGDETGWDSEVSDDETPEDKYIKVRPSLNLI